MCNGLTEKFNETMKLMLKRLCSEQPRRVFKQEFQKSFYNVQNMFCQEGSKY